MEICKRTLNKLILIDTVDSLVDLRKPSSNRLEKLKGRRSDEYSIRINKQWRICFRFHVGDAFNVGIEDYHR